MRIYIYACPLRYCPQKQQPHIYIRHNAIVNMMMAPSIRFSKRRKQVEKLLNVLAVYIAHRHNMEFKKKKKIKASKQTQNIHI